MMATQKGYHTDTIARQPCNGKATLQWRGPAPAPRRVIALPHACLRCGGAIITGAYQHPACEPCLHCGSHARCCPPRTPAQVVSDADTPDMAAVARMALRRLAAGAQVADTGALAGLLGDVIAGPPVAPAPADDADDAPAPQVAPRQLAMAL